MRNKINILILLFTVAIYGQGVNPVLNLKIQTKLDLYNLSQNGFTAKTTIPQTKEAATVEEAKAYLFLQEGPEYPIYAMSNNRLVPRYALEPRAVIPSLWLTGTTSTSLTFSFIDPIGGASASELRYIPDFEYGQFWVSNTSTPTPPRTIVNLLPTTTYYVQIRFFYPGNGYGEWSDLVIATTGGSVDNYPTAPVLTVSNVGSTTATLNWTAATDDIGIQGYRITRLKRVLLAWVTDGSSINVGSGTLSYNVTGLTPSTSYRWVVESRDTGNHYTPSNWGYGTTTSGQAGLVPPVLTAIQGEAPSVNLTWSPATGDVVVGYKLYYRNVTVGGSWHYIRIDDIPNFTFYAPESFYFTDQFEFYLIGVNAQGQTPWANSNTATATTLLGRYYLPNDYVVSKGQTIVLWSGALGQTVAPIVHWEYNTEAGETYVETTTSLTITNIQRSRSIKGYNSYGGLNQWQDSFFSIPSVDYQSNATRENPYNGNSDN